MVSMLAGLEAPDAGDGWIEQRSIVTDLDGARRKLGLCPQFDALRELVIQRTGPRLTLQVYHEQPDAFPLLVYMLLQPYFFLVVFL